MDKNSDGERPFAHRKDSSAGVSSKADVSDMEPPRGDQAHRHGEGLHLRLPLLRGGRHCPAGGHDPHQGAQHRRNPPREARATLRGGAGFRAHRFRVHSQAGAQEERLTMPVGIGLGCGGIS